MLLLLFVLNFGFAQESSDVTTDTTVVETMPRFPGCEDTALSEEEKHECSVQNLLEFVYTNIKYPPIARENGVEGIVVVEFIVTKEGTIDSINLARDVGANLGKAAVKMVESMRELDDRWTPGTQDGVPVNVKFTLPVKFSLEKKKKKKRKKKK